MLPRDWVSNVAFSFVAYLVGPPFTDDREWLDAQDYDVDGAQATTISTRKPRGPRLAGEGMKHGTLFSSGGPPQLLQLGLDPEQHLPVSGNLSLATGSGGIDVFLPDQDMPQDFDLTHAATETATHLGSLA